MKIAQKIPGLYDGVSQQPAALRFPQQCELQENCLNSIADGSSKRPPTEHMAQVYTAPLGEAHVHTIDRDLSERYDVVLTNGDLRVFDAVTGEQFVVGFTHGKDYLASTRPRTGFALITIADHTFIVNKDVTVTSDPLKVTDGTINNSKQQFSDVTKMKDVAEGTIIEVAGDDRSAFDVYYVKREGGVWRECARPSLVDGFDHATMPHVLVRNANGSFNFRQAEWDRRGAGDNETAPMPSFVDRTISDVFFHRNRLGLVTGENVVFTRSGKFFNWWRATATDLLDTDPIDLAASHTSVSTLRFGVPFDKTLMLMADQTQFVLSARDLLSPNTVGIDLATEFELSPDVKPVGAGPNMYFPTKNGEWAAIREYFVENETVTNNAVDTCAQIPRYIPHDVYQMGAASNQDMLFVLSASDPSAIYTYRWYWAGDEKRQSAWTRWTFPGTVLSAAVLDAYLYLLIESVDGVHIERMALQDKGQAPGLEFNIMLDRRVRVTGVYDLATDLTMWELPYDATGSDLELVDETGALVTIHSRPEGNVVKAEGDRTASPYFIGVPYEQVYGFSEVLPREGQEQSTIARGRLQLQTFTVFYSGTGYFDFTVNRVGQPGVPVSVAPAVVDSETGRILGQGDLTLGNPTVGDGWARIPVLTNSRYAKIELRNRSHLPSTFALASWEGDLTLPDRL